MRRPLFLSYVGGMGGHPRADRLPRYSSHISSHPFPPPPHPRAARLFLFSIAKFMSLVGLCRAPPPRRRPPRGRLREARAPPSAPPPALTLSPPEAAKCTNSAPPYPHPRPPHPPPQEAACAGRIQTRLRPAPPTPSRPPHGQERGRRRARPNDRAPPPPPVNATSPGGKGGGDAGRARTVKGASLHASPMRPRPPLARPPACLAHPLAHPAMSPSTRPPPRRWRSASAGAPQQTAVARARAGARSGERGSPSRGRAGPAGTAAGTRVRRRGGVVPWGALPTCPVAPLPPLSAIPPAHPPSPLHPPHPPHLRRNGFGRDKNTRYLTTSSGSGCASSVSVG